MPATDKNSQALWVLMGVMDGESRLRRIVGNANSPIWQPLS